MSARTDTSDIASYPEHEVELGSTSKDDELLAHDQINDKKAEKSAPIRELLFEEPTFALLATCFLVTLASLLLAKSLDGWILAASYTAIVVLSAMFIAWRLRYPQDQDSVSTKEAIADDNSDETIKDGIECYIQNSAYRFDIDDDDEQKWHKRGLNFVFDEASSAPLLKKELIRNVSHEIRTPLASIQLVAEGIEDGIFSIDDSSTMSQINESIQRMASTIEMMSSYVDCGIGSFGTHRSDLELTLDYVYERAKEAANKRGDIVVSFLDGSLMEKDSQGSGDVLTSDRDNACEHVMGNVVEKGSSKHEKGDLTVSLPQSSLDALFSSIVDNAFEHAIGMKKLTLSLAREHNPMKGLSMARVSIQDDGCGVDKKDAHKMIEPFWKNDRSRSEVSPSADNGDEKRSVSPGLGLSIAREMVVRAGGAFDVKSDTGEGTCVSVWLPLCS